MKKNLLLGLLLSGSLTAQAQSAGESLVKFSCPEPAHGRQTGNKALPADTPPVIANRVPDGPGPTQTSCSGVINVNIHFMLRLDGTGNFNETSNGFAYKP